MLARAAAKASAWRLRSPQLVTWPWWSMTAGVVGRASAFSTSRSQKVSCGHAPDRRYRSTWSRVRTVSSRRMSSSARAHTRAVRSGVVAMLHLLGRAGGLALPWGGPGTPSSASRGVLLVLDDRDPGTEGGPPPRGRADVHGPAEELGALPDSDEAKVTAGREVAVRGDREAPSVVGDVEPDLIPCEGQPHHDPGGLGLPLDVPDRLLGDAEEPELDGGREPPGDPDDVDPPAESRAAARLLHQLAEGRHEPQVVQDGGAEGVGELPQGPDEALGRGAGLPKGRGGLPGEGPADALHRVELAAQEDEFLDRVVVQLVGEPPSLLLVGPQDAGGEDPEVLLAAALFGHVAQQERVEVLSDPDDARVHPDHRPPARPHLEGPHLLRSVERRAGQRGRAGTTHEVLQAGGLAGARPPEPRPGGGVHGADGSGGPEDQDGEGARFEQAPVLRVGLFGVLAGGGLPVDAAPHEEGDAAHGDELDELGQALQAPVVQEDNGRVHRHAPEDRRRRSREPEGERRKGGGHEEERHQEEGQERAVGDVGVRGVVRQGDESDHPLAVARPLGPWSPERAGAFTRSPPLRARRPGGGGTGRASRPGSAWTRPA